MSRADAVAAVRAAEKQLWRELGLSVEETFVEAGDPPVRSRVLQCGRRGARPIVFLQGGIGESYRGWSLIARLTEFHCITLDRPGGGLSDPLDFREVDLRTLAPQVLAAVLDSVGLERACFVGNSMGGWWTFQLALRMPERVSRMVMIGCPAVLLDTAAPLQLRLTSIPVLGRVLAHSTRPPWRERTRLMPFFMGHPKEVGDRWTEAEVEVAYRFSRLPDVPKEWYMLLRRFMKPGGQNPEMRVSEGELRRLTQPTLYIWGSDDPFGELDAGRRAAALMPNARLEVVGVGHLPWWDDPDRCARLIRDFCAGDSAGSP